MEWKNSKVGTNLGVIFPSESGLNDLQNTLSPACGKPAERVFSDLKLLVKKKCECIYIESL